MLFKKICQFGTATILSLSIVCAVLKRYVWSGFSYVVLGLLSLLSLMWAAYFVYDYFTAYKEVLKQDYEDFKNAIEEDIRQDELLAAGGIDEE